MVGKIRVFTAFSGYDSQCLALERLSRDFPQFSYELVGWSEIDEAAITAHNILFPEAENLNFGDISKIDWDAVPDFDLFTMSSPCQDFSAAGKRAGGDEGSGTRSSLLWECTKAIEKKRPKYVIFENVASLVSHRFIRGFHKWQRRLEGFGYENFPRLLNSRDYGVPQNRIRIFMVSILRSDDNPKPSYFFPTPFPLEKRLKDILEDNVEDKYYLNDGILELFQRSYEKKRD